MRSMLMVAVLLLAGGCAFVTSPVIVGETPLNIEAVRSEWEGTWVAYEPAIRVSVVNATSGVLKVELIESGDEGKSSDNVFLVYLRESGGWTFATLASMENEETPDKEYVWGRLLMEEQRCILWLPDMDKFKTLVSTGVLPGKVDPAVVSEDGEIKRQKGVFLGELGTNHLALITSGTLGVLFDWENPMVVFKAGDSPAALPPPKGELKHRRLDPFPWEDQGYAAGRSAVRGDRSISGLGRRDREMAACTLLASRRGTHVRKDYGGRVPSVYESQPWSLFGPPDGK